MSKHAFVRLVFYGGISFAVSLDNGYKGPAAAESEGAMDGNNRRPASCGFELRWMGC